MVFYLHAFLHDFLLNKLRKHIDIRIPIGFESITAANVNVCMLKRSLFKIVILNLKMVKLRNVLCEIKFKALPYIL